MKNLLLLSIVSILWITFAAILPKTTSAQSSKFHRSVNGVVGRYIVVLHKQFVGEMDLQSSVWSEAELLQRVYGGDIKGVYAYALKGFIVEMSEDEAIVLSWDVRVDLVEQDAAIATSASEIAASWGLDRIDQRTLPLDSRYSWETDASNVHVYVIDSGIRPTHDDFGGRATADYDVLLDGANGIDCNGHGTHVAGTVGGGSYGVAKSVRLHGVRVLPCSGNGLVSNLLLGIDWVTGNRILPAVANISITISAGSPATDAAIQNSVNSGVTYVVAAGNSNQDACLFSPGRAPSAIAVGATVSSDAKAGYSNWGSCVDIWAPGTLIVSTGHTSDIATRTMSGTSMASPHVAGVAALYLAANPTASPATVASEIYSTSTLSSVLGLDQASPNRLVYSWLSTSPPPPAAAGRVAIRKQITVSGPVSIPTPAFPYTATSLSSANFSLYPDDQFIDSNITAFGSENTITVTESTTLGWEFTGITCVEISGSGLPNTLNTTVDVTARKATIIVEEGEQVECTFISRAIEPSVAYASVSGRVTTADGRGVRGARIDLLNSSTNEFRYVTTNTFGYFTLNHLPVGDFYVVSVSAVKKRGDWNPLAQSFTLQDNIFGMSFVFEH